MDDLCLCTEKGYLHHTVCRDDLCLDSFRPVSHFFIRETVVTHQAVIDAENVSKIIRDGRYRRACGQLGLYVEHFTPQFVPLLRMDAAESDGCSSKVILESPYMDSDFIL